MWHHCGITSRDDGTDNADVLFVEEKADTRKTVDCVAYLLDGMLDVNAFQFDKKVGVLFRFSGVMTEKVVTLVVGSVSIEVTINFIFIYDRNVTSDDSEFALLLLYGET